MRRAVRRFSEGRLSGEEREATLSATQVAFRLGIEEPERALGLSAHSADAREALSEALKWEEPERRERVAALIEHGETAHAKRYALCGRRSVQLECPPIAGGCGSEENYVPVHCDSRLCETCQNRRMGRLVEQYAPVVREMENPTLITLTQENAPNPLKGKQAIQGAFGRLRRRVVPPEGETVRRGRDGEERRRRWVWGGDNGKPANTDWKRALLAGGHHDLARRWEKRYVSEGRGIPAKEALRGGFYGIDIKQQGPERYHVHLHAIVDVAYIPQGALASVWEDITGAPVVDIRRIGEQGGQDFESAVMEVVGYVCKPPSFESVDAEAEYLKALKGSRLIQPFGSLHGNTPDVSGLLQCCDCERSPAFWNYLGYIQEHRSTALVGSAEDGDRPPPG
jgi:hypothetical protein